MQVYLLYCCSQCTSALFCPDTEPGARVLPPAAEAQFPFLFSFPCDSARALCPSHLGLFSLHTTLLLLPNFHTKVSALVCGVQ